MTDKELLKKIIENFENDNIDFENAKKEIELITNKEINEYTLRNSFQTSFLYLLLFLCGLFIELQVTEKVLAKDGLPC